MFFLGGSADKDKFKNPKWNKLVMNFVAINYKSFTIPSRYEIQFPQSTVDPF